MKSLKCNVSDFCFFIYANIYTFVYMELKFKPLGNTILVEEEEKKSVHGKLILPYKTRDISTIATIVKVSDIVQNTEGSVRQGEKVLFNTDDGDQIELDGKSFTLLDVDKILINISRF